MAEGIAAGLAETIITQLSSAALQEIGSAVGVKKEVRRLHNTLTAIKEVLPHAENLQLSNNDVKSWLRRIKDAAYDAEYVIDDFTTEALRKKLVMQGSIINQVRHFASSSNPILLRFKMAHRIKQVREDLRDILDDQSFGLEKIVQENFGINSARRQTYSYIPEEQVVGRDLEREELIKSLLDSSGRDSLSVIPIQGMGGIGKTALAQLVYNDKRVIERFTENRMWVCVSEEFDVKKIAEMIIKSATNKECPNLDMDQLQSDIRRHLGGKRYLLVLDDIWNEEFDKWEELRYLLTGGASGSKVVVTTRSKRVGSIMGTGVVLQLSNLSEGDCWNLFKDRAFQEGEERADPELVEIGRDIVKKCVGVPLAAKTLGGLCYQARKEMWEFVRDNDIWKLPEEKNGILRALRISYHHLPIYLKQCFAYCSIFPKDFKIRKEVLINLWIAQGFIPSFGNNQSLEDIGNEYVEVLMWRSFFQEPEVDDCGNLINFKMHDLVHDLAQSVAGVECFTVCKNKEENFPEGVRHLFFNIEEPSSTFETASKIPKPSNIRTLVFASTVDFFVGAIFSNLKFLRVFQFKDDNIDHLPNSIDKLKHLRYIQIECPKIKTLPESITNLLKLEVLNIWCQKLEKLPNRIQNMVNLKHIDFWKDPDPKTFEEKKIPFLTHMPSGLKELKSLQTLSHFVVSKNNVGCKLNGLNAMKNLGGTLDIWNLENVKNANDSEETNLKAKRKLWSLSLNWDEEKSSEAVSFEVLKNLEPPSNLKKLEMRGYVGNRFPRWMMEPSLSLPQVVRVELRNCKKCEQLFPFSCLPSLKLLILHDMDAIKCIEGTPEESKKNEWFPSLTTLKIEDCPNLESWFPMQSQQQLPISFPSLVHLWISNCPKLKNMRLLLPSIIKRLYLIFTSGELVHSILREGNSSLTSSSSLETLWIYKCEGMESWPNWLGPQLTSLRRLRIGCSRSLPFLPQQIQHLPSLRELGIWDYSEVALPEWIGNLTSLQLLWIQECPNLQILLESIGNLTSLQHLVIKSCPNLQILLESIANITSLQNLDIRWCKNLQILPESIGNITSLQNLWIEKCPNLQILPEWVLRDNTTIQYLEIDGCPELRRRYNKETGEDRHKIAHIRLTEIDS